MQLLSWGESFCAEAFVRRTKGTMFVFPVGILVDSLMKSQRSSRNDLICALVP